MGIRNSIAGALPSLIAAHGMLLARAHAMGIDFDIADFGGVRSLADTILIMGYRAAEYAAAVARNSSVSFIPINVWRPIAPYGLSMHNYGAAFDVEITDTPSGMSREDALSHLKAAASSVGLRSNVPNDPPHFELPITLEDAKASWESSRPSGGITVLTTENIAAASTVAVVVAGILTLTYLNRRRRV
jgi:hypothetical protein